jgi:GNAT superfamily N-acetyltransferase
VHPVNRRWGRTGRRGSCSQGEARLCGRSPGPQHAALGEGETVPSANGIQIVRTLPSDAPWIEALIRTAWGDALVVVHDTAYRPHALPGLKALMAGQPVGLLTYHVSRGECEIVTLNSLVERAGVGTALMDALVGKSQEENWTRIWLRTTNDNLDALRFYQKRGFSLACIDRHAVERARKLKPAIPSIGDHGIPLRDEIELEWVR